MKRSSGHTGSPATGTLEPAPRFTNGQLAGNSTRIVYAGWARSSRAGYTRRSGARWCTRGPTRMDKIERQREHFESISERYYASRRASSHLTLKDLIWEYFFADKDFLKKDGLSVLEPMCGYAEGKAILEKHLVPNFAYEGFDYSETLVRMVRKRDPSLNVFHMDVTRFRASKRYDLIILVGGLHHVPDHVDQILKNLGDALTKGGFIISFEPTHNNPAYKKIRDFTYRRNAFFDAETERAFELSELNGLFQSNGFQVIDQIYPGLLAYVLYYNPDAFPLLNVGGARAVRFLFGIEKRVYRSAVGRGLSFTTLGLWQKT
jgi:SAM-dependent methyltransferase